MFGVRVARPAGALRSGGLASLACRCRHASAVLAPARPAAVARRALSSLSEDNFSVWIQWDDWLATGLAMDDVAGQEEFLGEKKILPQQYFLHAGTPEFSPFQPLHERLYRVAHGFEQEDNTMMTVHEGDVVELLEQSDTGWWRMQVSAGEHHYEGWVPEDVIDHDTQPDAEESDIFAMGRIWHGDSSQALALQEDTQVAELIDFLSDVAGTDVTLLADGQALDPTDYVGSSILNHVITVVAGGVEAVKANDGCHILPYYTRLQQWNYDMAIDIQTNAEWEETVFHTKEDGVLLVSMWHDPSASDANSYDLLERVHEMADEFRDVVFGTIDVTVNTEAASSEVAYWNKKPPALLLFKDGTVVASMDGQDASEEALRSAIIEHRPELED